jgi:hypothetical protein
VVVVLLGDDVYVRRHTHDHQLRSTPRSCAGVAGVATLCMHTAAAAVKQLTPPPHAQSRRQCCCCWCCLTHLEAGAREVDASCCVCVLLVECDHLVIE